MRALLVLHEHVTEPGPIGERLAERGYRSTEIVVVPRARHFTPDVSFDFPGPEPWDLIVSFGAPWSVYDTGAVGSWIDGEIALLRKACHLGVPVLGICFGAQVLAAALGGSVRAARRPEIGWTEITTEASGWMPSGPWFEWHSDECVLPPGAEELARTEVCAQAFRSGRALGVQFHPEITVPTLSGWLRFGGEAECERRGIDAGRLLERCAAMEASSAARARRLVDGFLDHVADAP